MKKKHISFGKLTFDKQTIAKLSKHTMRQINGGGFERIDEATAISDDCNGGPSSGQTGCNSRPFTIKKGS